MSIQPIQLKEYTDLLVNYEKVAKSHHRSEALYKVAYITCMVAAVALYGFTFAILLEIIPITLPIWAAISLIFAPFIPILLISPASKRAIFHKEAAQVAHGMDQTAKRMEFPPFEKLLKDLTFLGESLPSYRELYQNFPEILGLLNRLEQLSEDFKLKKKEKAKKTFQKWAEVEKHIFVELVKKEEQLLVEWLEKEKQVFRECYQRSPKIFQLLIDSYKQSLLSGPHLMEKDKQAYQQLYQDSPETLLKFLTPYLYYEKQVAGFQESSVRMSAKQKLQFPFQRLNQLFAEAMEMRTQLISSLENGSANDQKDLFIAYFPELEKFQIEIQTILRYVEDHIAEELKKDHSTEFSTTLQSLKKTLKTANESLGITLRSLPPAISALTALTDVNRLQKLEENLYEFLKEKLPAEKISLMGAVSLNQIAEFLSKTPLSEQLVHRLIQTYDKLADLLQEASQLKTSRYQNVTKWTVIHANSRHAYIEQAARALIHQAIALRNLRNPLKHDKIEDIGSFVPGAYQELPSLQERAACERLGEPQFFFQKKNGGVLLFDQFVLRGSILTSLENAYELLFPSEVPPQINEKAGVALPAPHLSQEPLHPAE
ncbi:MAG: hypothetical protein KGJ02_03025 [Verrucomicrobiota bacterium]|nr:hypothetical protein [Verrucomicrobiota bacterium]